MPDGFLSLFDATERLVLSPPGSDREFWVEIKHYLTGEEDDACTQAMFRLAGGGLEMSALVTDDPEQAQQQLHGRVDNGAFTRALVLHSIVGWNLTDRDGAPLPLAPAADKERSVGMLPAAVIDRIAARVLTIRQEQKPSRARRATFRGPAERSNPNGDDPAAGAAGVLDRGRLLAAPGTEEG